MPDITLFNTWLSVFLQIAAVILALRLIPLTRKTSAWILLSLAFTLMASRRLLDLLLGESIISDPDMHQFATRTVALFISILLFAGIYMIRHVFIQHREDAEQIHKLSIAIDQSPSATVIFSPDSEIQYVNSKYCELSKRSVDQLHGKIPHFLNPAYTPASLLHKIWDHISKGGVWRGELCTRNDDGTLYWSRTIISPVMNQKEDTVYYIATLEDITIEKQQRKAIKQLSLHDALTDLPNRSFFNDSLQYAIRDADCNRSRIAVLLLDINNFKEINNALGHLTGDVVLREISRRLHTIAKDNSELTLARMGGDEFLLYATNTDDDKTRFLAKRLITLISKPFIVEHRSLELTANIGYAFYPEHGESADALIKSADVAMYAAKESTESIVAYTPNLDDGKLKRLELTTHIRQATEENEFILHYQPQMEIASGKITGVEVLIRWLHPEYGIIPPDEFIELAEQSGHIFMITSWVIEKSIAQLAEWHAQGLELDIAINISASDIQNPELLSKLETELTKHHIAPEKIKLEITEGSLLLYTPQTIKALQYINNTGIQISIDDFGTGYSSLQYLKNMPVSQVKIDRSFVTNMLKNDNDAVIVRSTIDMSHNLGMKIVAEGIEDQETHDILEILRCDYVQGFHLAKPMNGASFIEWLTTYNARHMQNTKLKAATS